MPPALRQAARLVLTAAAAIGAPALVAAQTVLPDTAFNGRAWYVDSAAGSDSNAGTRDRPFRTLARASQVVLGRGDALLLKCGSVFRESLAITRYNAPKGMPTVGAYGGCTTANRPVLTGADRVNTTWTYDGSFGGKPVYVANWNSSVGTLYWNGTPLVKARYPNYGGIGKEFALMKNGAGGDGFTLESADASALSGKDLSGADVKMRTKVFVIEGGTVEWASNGTINLKSAPTHAAPRTGVGFYLQGKKSLLDAAGEWHYDANAKKLYVWTWNGASPASGLLETVTRSVGLKVTDVADLRLDKLALDRHVDHSLLMQGASHARISRLLSTRVEGTAIMLQRWTYDGADTQIVDSEVNEAATTSIYVATDDAMITRSVFRENGMGSRGTAKWGAAIKLNAARTQFVENQILRSSAVGINVGDAPGVVIRGNEIARACSRLTDCGALYAWGQTTSSQRKTVASNYVHDMVANTEGAVGGAPKLVVGLYVDHKTRNFDFIGNMVSRIGVDVDTGKAAGEGMGIHVQSSAYNRIEDNKVWLVSKASMHMQSSWDPLGDLLRGNVVQDNLFFAGGFWTNVNGASKYVPADSQAYFHRVSPWNVFAGLNPNVVQRNTTATLDGSDGSYWLLYSPGGAKRYPLSGWRTYGWSEKVLAPYSRAGQSASFVKTEESTLLANPTNQYKTLYCADTVLRNCNVTNLSGGWVSWPVTLAPRGSLVVVSADSAWSALR